MVCGQHQVNADLFNSIYNKYFLMVHYNRSLLGTFIGIDLQPQQKEALSFYLLSFSFT